MHLMRLPFTRPLLPSKTGRPGRSRGAAATGRCSLHKKSACLQAGGPRSKRGNGESVRKGRKFDDDRVERRRGAMVQAGSGAYMAIFGLAR